METGKVPFKSRRSEVLTLEVLSTAQQLSTIKLHLKKTIIRHKTPFEKELLLPSGSVVMAETNEMPAL